MNLRIVPSPGEQTDSNNRSKTKEPDGTDANSVENAGVLFLAFILIFLPLFTYTVASNHWGYEIGTHVGFITGVFCVLLGSYVIFFSGLFYKFDWD